MTQLYQGREVFCDVELLLAPYNLSEMITYIVWWLQLSLWQIVNYFVKKSYVGHGSK